MAKQVPVQWRNRILHATLVVDGTSSMGADSPPGRIEERKGFSVTVRVETAEDAERLFQALTEKGKVRLPMQKTFWALRFGMLEDQFGIPWMESCEQSGITGA